MFVVAFTTLVATRATFYHKYQGHQQSIVSPQPPTARATGYFSARPTNPWPRGHHGSASLAAVGSLNIEEYNNEWCCICCYSNVCSVSFRILSPNTTTCHPTLNTPGNTFCEPDVDGIRGKGFRIQFFQKMLTKHVRNLSKM